VQKIDTLWLVVSDLGAAIDFYEGLGLLCNLQVQRPGPLPDFSLPDPRLPGRNGRVVAYPNGLIPSFGNSSTNGTGFNWLTQEVSIPWIVPRRMSSSEILSTQSGDSSWPA
jgi:hypothetical protein